MTTYYQQPDTRPRPPKRRILRKAIIPAAALFLGVGMGAAGAGGPQEPAAAPEPAPTVTQTVETPGPVQTKTVEVPGPETVPSDCTRALDLADQGFTVSSEILAAIQGGIASGDFSGADAGNAELGTIAPKYNAAKAACRAAAGTGS